MLFVDDGNLITSAGTAAGIDACLQIVRRELGSRVTNIIARRMVVPPSATAASGSSLISRCRRTAHRVSLRNSLDPGESGQGALGGDDGAPREHVGT